MTYYEIFSLCFEQFNFTEEIFKTLTDFENITKIDHFENNELVGYAFIHKNALRLLCVAPEYQNRGIGKSLIDKAIIFIKENRNTEILIGGASSELFIGAPENIASYFLNLGFDCVGESEEMTRTIVDFNSDDFEIRLPDGCDFGWFNGDFEVLKTAISKVDEDWIQYFSPKSRIFCGYLNGEIASFCLVDYQTTCILSNGNNKVGVIGCVGTVPEYRRKGIGLKMVALASDDLKYNGCDLCFIHYTGVAHWYAKLGYQTFLKLTFLKKSI